MFCFSPNAIQLDGSVSSGHSTSNLTVSSELPINTIVSSLQEYMNECSDDTPVQNAIQAVINELEGSPTNNITLPLILSREIIRILSIYSNARCAQQPAPSLKDFRQKFVGASGLSLSSYLAQYIIASSDSNEELSSSTVAALITVIELAVMFEQHGLWPSKSTSFVVSGASRPQILTASRMSNAEFSVPVVLDTNKAIIKGPASNLSKLSTFIQQKYNKTITSKALQTTDDLPTASLIDFHPTAANFSALMMEKLPPVLMRLQGFISRNSNFPSERQLKIPLISPFDGCVTGKSLVCQVRMVPSMGTPMFDAMLDFLTGRPIDLPLLRSTINFLLNKSQPNQRSLFILSTTGKSHEVQSDTTKPPSFEFGEQEIPLNINQKMIALHHQRYPSSCIYNITDIVRVQGVVDKAKLIDAVQMAYILHPSCSMTIKDTDTAVLASNSTLRSFAERSVIIHEPIKEEDLMAATSANTKEPFNLSEQRGLLRFHVYPIASTNTTVIQGMVHHLASDGFSGFAISPRVIQFHTREDDLFWQLVHAHRPAAVDVMLHFNMCQTQLAHTNNSMKDFWNAKVASGEFDNRLDMLTSAPRGAPTFNGAERIVKVDSSIWEGLKNKSTELGSTRFNLLAAAWSIVVSRYSQQNKFNLGTAFHCRKEDWLDATIFTSNAMPVRVQVDPELNLKDFVSSLKKSVASCKVNEEYPASALIKNILDTKKIVTSQGQSPLFQIEMNYYHIPSLPKLTTKELVMKERIYPHFMQAGMTDLTAWFVTLNNGVILNIKYNTDLYKQDLVEQIEGDLINLLKLLVSSAPDTSVNEIVRLSGKSLENRGYGPIRKGPFVPMFARVMNFGNSLEHGNRLAVADQNNSLTFQQLSTAVRGVTKMIQGHVTGKHQVVAVLMDRSALYTTSMLGIMRAGCVYLPLNSADPIDRIKGILEDAQATLVITQPNKLDILKDITSIRPLVVSLEEVMKPVEVSLPVIGMKDPCYMIFTSGTTGKPKGVVVPHMALSNLANEMSASFSDVQGPNLALFEFSFDAHLHDVVMSISRGCPLVISKPFGNKDPQYIIDTVNQFKVTTILMVPSMLSMILDYFDINASEKTKFSSVRLVGCGGEALYVKLVERTKKSLPSVRVINNYGPTEACVLCSFYDCNKLPETKSANDVVPIGAAIRNSELLILGEDRNIVPIGVTGQLYIGGDCLALGYANNPQQTQAKFVDHPYAQGKRLYASGDLAKYLPNGEIHFLGRADNQIKLRGYRIECGEIESSILGCSGVKMSSVIVHKSEQREQCLVGFVEFDSSVNNDAKVSNLTRVLGELKTKLPQYMVPTRLVSIDKFPLTSHGKVDAKQLPNPFESTYFCDQHSAGSTGAIKPLSSDAEKKIAKCFAEVLSISESTIGSNSNFFDLGGSSLHAFTLVNKISEALGVKLELKQFFDNASPGELAKLFDAQAAKQLSENSLDRYKKKPLTHYECIKLKEATEAPATNIFLVHGAFRNGVVFKDVASKFPNYVTVYSFQDSTPLEVQETDDHHPPTTEEFADIYVKLLLKVQSSGIYHLAGYCFGGVLVCEMAHQMLQKGCNVCTVALIDATAPSIVNARGLSDISAPTIFRMISFEIAMSLMGKTSDLTEDDFKHLKTPQQQKQALINAFSDKIDKKILVPFVERALAHFASSSGLLTNYRFKPLRGQITLLSAKEKWALYNYYNPMGINDLGWKSLHENVNVTMTPGDHLTIIRDTKAIGVVVDNLVKLLEQEGAVYMKLPTVRETLNLQSVPTLDNLEKRVPNDLLRIDIPESGPINPVAAIHRAVYYSLMAPSGHNIQPWKVYIDETNLKIVLCLNKKRIPPFFLAVDSLSFYDRTSAAGAAYIIHQLLQGYGFQVMQQVLESNANFDLEPFMLISIAPAGAGTAKPALMKRQQSLGALNRPKMINQGSSNSPAGIPKQPNSPVMPRDGQLNPNSLPSQGPKKVMGLPKRPLPGKVQHGEIRRLPSGTQLSPTPSVKQVSAADQEIPKQPSSPQLTRATPSSQSSPNILRQERQEAAKQFESLVSQRVTNRHNYSKRRVVPMRILQHLSNPALAQDPVRVLVINDPAQIEMISKYVEDIETNSYVSDCVRKLIGNIGVQEEQRNHTVPLDALELGQMQLVTATKVVTMDQNTIMTMKAHKALGIATGQKILNSAGLLVFVGPRDCSLNELTNALGASLIAAMLKCTEYNIATHPWTTAFLLQRLLWPLNGRLSELGEKVRQEVTQETPDFFEQLDMLRHIVPQIKNDEMPLIVVRFGYPDEEISGHSTRLPASDSVTLIKQGDVVPNEIKPLFN